MQVGSASRSAFLTVYEAPIVAHLATFTIPADYREKLRAHVAGEATFGADAAPRRRRIQGRLARIEELYGWGDMHRGEYLAERDLLLRDPAALDARETGETAHLDRLAELLGDVARGWGLVTGEQRNRLARLLFEEVVIGDDGAAAVRPRPELAGFFALDHERWGATAGNETAPAKGGCKGAEVTGDASARSIHGGPFPAYFPVPAPPAAPRPVPPQQRPHLSPAQRREIARRADGESLHDLAAAYGVSHETIRAVVQRVRDTGAAQASDWR